MKIVRLSVGELRTNCYIVSSDATHAVIIDPGSEAKNILTKLKDENLVLEAILITHGHYDHIGAILEVSKATGCNKICVGKDDWELLTDAKKSYASTVNQSALDIGNKTVIMAEGLLEFDGIMVNAIKTPGHTKGSVCYLIEGVLFSGDTLFHGGIGRTDMYGGSYVEIKASLKELSKLAESTLVYPGHGLRTKIGSELYA